MITRGGRRLASIGPVPVSNGADLADAIAAWRDRHPGDDPTYADDVMGARELLTDEDPWGA